MDVALACTTYAFLYRGGRKWKLLSVVFLVVVSPFYLKLNPDFPFFQFTEPVLVSIWLFLMPIGVFILIMNLRIFAHHLILNPPKQNKKEKQKPEPKPDISVAKELTAIKNTTLLLIGSIILALVSFSLHNSLEILQFPLQLFGLICVIYLGISYYQNDKKTRSLNKRLTSSLRDYFLSFYVIMFFAFVYLMLYLQTILFNNVPLLGS